MTRSLAHIGVLAIVVGLLSTACVGSAWSMEILTDEQLDAVAGSQCNAKCRHLGNCLFLPCPVPEAACWTCSQNHSNRWCVSGASSDYCTDDEPMEAGCGVFLVGTCSSVKVCVRNSGSPEYGDCDRLSAAGDDC